MTEKYPDHPNLRGNYAPIRMESDINDLIVEGEIPKDLFVAIIVMGQILSSHLGVVIIIGLVAMA